MTYYITTNALTEGILEAEGTQNSTGSVRYRRKLDRAVEDNVALAGEWHLTLEEAISKAKDMRNKKLVQLAKQQAKIRELQFTGAKEV